MALRLSTGFAHATNVIGDTKTVMAEGVIAIFDGTQPADADLTEAGYNLLMYLTLDGNAFTPGGGAGCNGLNMDVDVAGVLSKAVAEVWSGVGLAAAGTGGTTAVWFRWYDSSHTTGASTSAIRVDGSIGTTTLYQMRMSNTTIVTGGPSVVSSFTYTRPRA
jgi:hypothetical protein